MKKTLKKVLQVLFLVSLCTCFFPVCVHAEEVTTPYYDTSPIRVSLGTGGYSGNDLYVKASDFRVVFSNINSSEFQFAIVSPDLNAKKILQSNGINGDYYVPTESDWANSGTNITRTIVKDGVTYKIGYWTTTKSHQNIQIEYATNQSFRNNDELIWELTYGYEDPVTPINWGELRELRYTTSIVGNNEACMQNKDTITWDFPYDTNNNDISECTVELRVVKGRYSGTDKTDLLYKKYTDFVYDLTNSSQLGTFQASQVKATFTWSYVCNKLNIVNFLNLAAHLDNEYWIKEGWIYQARLINAEEEYTGEWQTVYTATSASAAGSETIITNNNYDVNVYQSLQEITVVNNNTSIVFTYQDTDINITNPDDGTEPSGGTSLWDVLKQLITGIFQILAKLGDLVGDLIGSILDLFRNMFTPQEIDQTINNEVNVNINTYLEDDQPGLNDIHTNINTWKLQLEDIAADYSSGGDCILQWNDVAMNLSVFGAGNVTFIPAGTYDLKAAFLNLLSGFGVSYSTYQMLVSAVIYISLIVLISHKVKGFLKT